MTILQKKLSGSGKQHTMLVYITANYKTSTPASQSCVVYIYCFFPNGSHPNACCHGIKRFCRLMNRWKETQMDSLPLMLDTSFI